MFPATASVIAIVIIVTRSNAGITGKSYPRIFLPPVEYSLDDNIPTLSDIFHHPRGTKILGIRYLSV